MKSAKKPCSASPSKSKNRIKPESVAEPGQEGLTLSDILPRLLGVAIVSLTGALAIAYLAYAVVQFLPSLDILIGKTMSQSIIVTVFLGSFIFIFIPLLKRFVPSIQSSRKRQAELATAYPSPAPNIAMDGTPLPNQVSSVGGPIENTSTSSNFSDGGRRTIDPFGTGAGGLDKDVDWSSLDDPDEGNDRTGEQDGTGEQVADDEVGGSPATKPDVSAEILKFIRDSLEPLAAAGHELNAFNRFGLTLYFAGAGAYMATRHKLSEQEITDILCAHAQYTTRSCWLWPGHLDWWFFRGRGNESAQWLDACR